MDDPWGSPWDAAPAATGAKAEGLESFTSPLQEASLTNDANNVTAPPWEEQDDAWGGWSAPTEHNETWQISRKTEDDPWAQSAEPANEQTLGITTSSDANLVEARKQPKASKEIPYTETNAGTDEQTRAPKDEDTIGHTTQTANGPAPQNTIDVENYAEDTKASKVQELVVMYDGLSKPATSSDGSIPSETGRKSSEASIIHEADEDDVSIASGNSEQEAAKPDEQPSKQDIGRGNNHITISDDKAAKELLPSPSKRTNIPYPINLAILDTLLPNTKPLATPPAQLPDSVITDSFTSVNERKTWYRVSRFGSSRKHDDGNDETYRRVTWQNSEVRNKTIRIVRRWMEEDSIAGKVILGKKSAAIGASMFNWDSSEPTVEIDTLLRQRREESRPPSRNISESIRTPAAAEQDEAAFAWGSSGAETPKELEPVELPPTDTKDLQTPDMARVPSPSLGWSPWDDSSRASHRPSSTVPSVPSGLQFSESAAYEDDEENDDDNDWGEMVTSQDAQQDSAFEDFPAAAPGQTPSLATLDSSPITAAEPDFPAHVSMSKLSSDWDLGGFDDPALEHRFEAPPSPFEDLHTPTAAEEHRTLSPPVEKKIQLSSGAQEQQAPALDLDVILSNIPDLSYMLR